MVEYEAMMTDAAPCSIEVAVRHALEAVEFIADNGGGVGVRFREARRERPRV